MISRLRALWNNVFRRRQLDRDLDEELEAYVELLTAEKLEAGMPPEEAHSHARRQTGGRDQVVQGVRDIRAGAWLDRCAQDLRYGIRRWRRAGLLPWWRWERWRLESGRTPRCSACSIR